MEIFLYSFLKKENSTAQPITGKEFVGELLPTCSITAPVIKFGTIKNPQGFNYAYIPLFSRYYWVNDWNFTGAFWAASMSTDVLATYRDQIGRSTQYILRSAAEHDGAVIDSLFPLKPQPVITVNHGSLGWSDSAVTYVVGIIGKAGAGTFYYSFTPTAFASFAQNLFGPENYTGDDGLPADITLDYFKAQFNPLQYLTTCRAYPFPVVGQAGGIIPVGWIELAKPDGCSRLPDQNVKFSFSIPGANHPDIAEGSFYNCRPYTQVVLTVPCFGQMELSASDLGGGGVNCEISLFPPTGDAILTVSNSAGKPIYRTRSCIGANVQVNQFTKNYAGFAAGVAGTITSALTGNFIGAASGVASAAGSIMPQMTSSGSTETLAECAIKPSLTYRFFRSVEHDNENHGAPLCKPRQISKLPGYILCENPEVAINGTADESTTIKQYMTGGFYFE